jgi:hypothetical protein
MKIQTPGTNPSSDGRYSIDKLVSALRDLREHFYGTYPDDELNAGIRESLQDLQASATEAAELWMSKFLDCASDVPHEFIGMDKGLTATAQLVMKDPASLPFFRPVFEFLDEARTLQPRTAEGIALVGFDPSSRSFSPHPPLLASAVEAFAAARDDMISFIRGNSPDRYGYYYETENLVLEREKAALQSLEDLPAPSFKDSPAAIAALPEYVGPSAGLRGTGIPSSPSIHDLGPFYQAVVADIERYVAPSLANRDLHPIVDTDDAEKGVTVKFANEIDEGFLSVWIEGPATSTLHRATWQKAELVRSYTELSPIGTNGWSRITWDYDREKTHGTDTEILQLLISENLEDDLISRYEAAPPLCVTSYALAQAWKVLAQRADPGFEGEIGKDENGSEHLAFTDLNLDRHVLSAHNHDDWTLVGVNGIIAEGNDIRSLVEAIEYYALVEDYAKDLRPLPC